MPVQRINLSRTAPDPDEGSVAPPSPASGPGMGIAKVASLVEEAKARSRAAMEAKLQKQRSKERKSSNLASDASYRQQKSAAQRLERVWRDEMALAFPDIPQIAWFKHERGKLVARKEGKLAADLLDGYGGDEKVCADIVETFVRHWNAFGPMLTRQEGGVPTFGLLYACHATVVAEGVRLKRQHDAVSRYEDWKREHAGDDFAVAPPELEAAYKAAIAKRGKK